jgi:hypothetical protein
MWRKNEGNGSKEIAARLGRSEVGVRLHVRRLKSLPPNASPLKFTSRCHQHDPG